MSDPDGAADANVSLSRNQSVLTSIASATPSPTPPPPTPLEGGRPVLKGLSRNLAPEELATPAGAKFLVEMLETAERERDDYRQYMNKFHDANLRASVAEHVLRRDLSNEVMFSVGVGVGCLVLGLVPSFYVLAGWASGAAAIVGILLVAGACVGRMKR